ncbi:hypothetical protein SAMN04489859_102041 [Paracoccus alcaliphilus]|uniref:Uncharacterized protein n=1 Tax=Paracoccus alcaliphilus TaxID=34002 RepID=A0A1H8K4K8_9RHOB|nr:hypothetical protein [Paracoccus alcaliphilus]WCR17537.1 hypothetical protein JHW40_14545 [Paracoccus alcaliphilus]SEN87627.1 hypothetical protein SAMN04489859_102041 [Paracoccus alcaliphilus]
MRAAANAVILAVLAFLAAVTMYIFLFAFTSDPEAARPARCEGLGGAECWAAMQQGWQE